MADIQVIVSDQSANAILETGIVGRHNAQFPRQDGIGEFPETAAAVSCVVVTDGDENDSPPSGGEDVELVANPGNNAVLCSIRRQQQQHRRRHHRQNNNNNDVTDSSKALRTSLDSGEGSRVSDHCDQEVDGGSCASVSGLLAAAARRKKHRRGKSKKRKWKPYNKLTWEEKQELEDRVARRAHRVREERFAHGQPVAPYNTTQFLMEDHNVQEPDLDNILNGHRQHRESTGTIDSDEYYSSPEDEEEFLQKEFCEVYDNIHAERLSSMTKLELIQEYMHLEDRVEKLEQKLRGELNRVQQQQQGVANVDSAGNLEKILIFQQEVHKLTEENDRLRRENDLLRHESAKPVEPVNIKDAPLDGQSVSVELMEHSGNDDEERTDNDLH